MTEKELRIAVVGAGRMGSDHVERIRDRMQRARITAVVDIDHHKAEAAVEGIEGARTYAEITDALDSGEVDAVLIATPGFLHEPVLLPVIARGLPVLCEKPLTADSESAWRIVQAEAQLGRKLVQVGFMRRFDAGYRRIRAAVEDGAHGELLALDCEHINPDVPESYTGRNLIDDTVVHEIDIVRFLTGEEIQSVQVRTGKTSRHAKSGLNDPAQILFETTSGVRITVSTHVTAQYGYVVSTRAVFEDTHLTEGADQVCPGFEERFLEAYDTEVQEWIDASLRGEIAGPSAWDGYAATAGCEAGIRATETPGSAVAVELQDKPDLYR